MKTRIYTEGNQYIFQDDLNPDNTEGLNISNTEHSVSNGRHYFRQGDRAIKSFVFSDILDANGKVYESEKTFITTLRRSVTEKEDGFLSHRLITGAGTNATLIKGKETKLFGALLSNNSAAPLYVKYYDKATVPIVGTDIPKLTFIVKTKDSLFVNNGNNGIEFKNGLGIAVTGAFIDSDTTATVANDLIAQSFFDYGSKETMIGAVTSNGTTVSVLSASGKLIGVVTAVGSTISDLTIKEVIFGVITTSSTTVSELSAKGALIGAIAPASNTVSVLTAAA